VGREALEAQLLDVEDDLGDVLLDARDRRELLVDVTDLDDVTAAPSSDERRTRRSALPRSRRSRPAVGLASYLAYVPASSTGSICGVLEFDHERGYLE
jgi:hypothetical protein